MKLRFNIVEPTGARLIRKTRDLHDERDEYKVTRVIKARSPSGMVRKLMKLPPWEMARNFRNGGLQVKVNGKWRSVKMNHPNVGIEAALQAYLSILHDRVRSGVEWVVNESREQKS